MSGVDIAQGATSLVAGATANQADITVSTVSFEPGIGTPLIKQATPTSDVATNTMTIRAQNAFASAITNINGAELIFTSGSAASGGTAGNLAFQCGGTTIFQAQSTQVLLFTNTLAWQSTETTPTLIHNTSATNSATGKTLSVQAQNMSGTTTIGGTLLLTSGTGTTAAGPVLIKTGGTTLLTANANGVITIANLSTGIVSSDSSGNLSSSTSPTATTQAAGNNSTSLATTAYSDRNFYLPTVAGFREDFIHQGGAGSVTAAATLFGDTNWTTAQISGGTQTQAPTAGTFANPGQLLLTTSATTGQGIAVYKAGQGSLGNLAAQAGWDIHIICKLGQTTNCCMRVGVCKGTTQVTDPPTDWFGIEYDTANTGNSDTDLTWVTRSSSTPNYSTTNAIAVNTGFNHFRMRSLVAGAILFSVNGGVETSISTDVSAQLMEPFIQLLARSNGAVTMTVDFYSLILETTRT